MKPVKETGGKPKMRVGDGTPGPGRPKGVPNKNTRLVKEAIAEAFERLGGMERLVAWAQESDENEKVFYTTLLPKLIPVQTELTGKDGEDIKFRQTKDDADAVRRRLLAGVTALGVASAASDTVQ